MSEQVNHESISMDGLSKLDIPREMLTPEERQEAQKVGDELRRVVTDILGASRRKTIKDPSGKKEAIGIYGRDDVLHTGFRGADFGLSRNSVQEDTGIPGRVHEQKLWHFFQPDIIKTVKTKKEDYTGRVLERTAHEMEADKEDLTGLLEDLKNGEEQAPA